jgi:transposase
VGTDLLQTLKIITDLAVENVGHRLAVFAILDILLSVEEPVWDLVLARIRHNRDDLLNLGEKKETRSGFIEDTNNKNALLQRNMAIH